MEPTLSPADHAVLDRVLANEPDPAFRRRALRLLEFLELEDGQRILDCGCGMGFYLLAMARLRRLELVGLDADPQALAKARAAVDAELVEGDATQLPFPDGSFDRVLMSEVLEHLSDDGAGLAEARRVLRPGGVLAISVPNADYPLAWDPISAALTGLGRPPIRSGPVVGIWTNHVRLYRPDELVAAVTAAGFDVERVERATRWCVPFAHFLLYGVGKPLVERGLLPRSLRPSADRMAGESSQGPRIDPVALVRRVFRLVDRLNERSGARDAGPSVNVLVKARKPG